MKTLIAVKDAVKDTVMNIIHPKEDEVLAQLEVLREDLVQVRIQIKSMNLVYASIDPDYRESVAHELNALKEKEHALIKKAKALTGERINIETSLREYREEQLSGQ